MANQASATTAPRTVERKPYSPAQRVMELTNEDVETLKALKALWSLRTDSQVVRRLLADHGLPVVYAARNNVDDIRRQMGHLIGRTTR